MTRTTIRASQCQHILSYRTDIHFILPAVKLDYSTPLCPECIHYGVKVVVGGGGGILGVLYASDMRIEEDVEMNVDEAVSTAGGMSTLANGSGLAAPSPSSSPTGTQTQAQAAEERKEPDYLANILSTYKKYHLDTYYPYNNNDNTPSTTALAQRMHNLTLAQRPFNPFTPNHPCSQPQHQFNYFSTIRTVPYQDNMINPRNEGFLVQLPGIGLQTGGGGRVGEQWEFTREDWARCVMMRMCETGEVDYVKAERALWEDIGRLGACLSG